MPKLRIEEAAARRQARIDRGEETIVGVNKYRLDDEADVDIREIDNTAVRDQQIARLDRDPRQPRRSRVPCGARSPHRRRARRRQPARAERRRHPGPRHRRRDLRRARGGVLPPPRRRPYDLPACTAARYEGDEGYAQIRREVEEFAAAEGRRPRLLVVKMGQDGHDRGAKVIATAFADLGFDVDVGPLFQTPEEAARDAIENDVHVVGREQPGRRPQDAGPRAHRAAAQAGRRRHRRGVRRRDPGAGLRVPARGRRRPRSSVRAPTSRRPRRRCWRSSAAASA